MLFSRKYCFITKTLPLIVSVLFNTPLFSQIKVLGPTCVASSTEYLYKIHGKASNESSVRICVTGGIIQGENQTCIERKTDELTIIWDAKSATGSIRITSLKGSTTISVVKATELTGGVIDRLVKVQDLNIHKKASVITCPPAKGGSCMPSYAYQWQRSDNALAWKDIDGSTGENLKLAKLPELTTYYRRKVTENASNTVEYSDVATVFIVPIADKFINY